MTSKRKRPPPAPQQADPTPERLLKAGGDVEYGDDKRGRRITTIRDAPLERALARNVITRGQYDAGAKYRLHWYHAGLSPISAIDLSRIFSGGDGFTGMAKTETQAFHRQRYRQAVQAVGIINAMVLERAICSERPLEEIGFALGWTSSARAYAAAVERFRASLDELCGIWGLTK